MCGNAITAGIVTAKVCTKCGETKTVDDFYDAKDMKDGKQSLCKSCKKAHSRKWWHSNIEKNRENVRSWHKANSESVKQNVRRWKKNNPDKMREQHLKRKYGITEADYQKILIDQRGACAICGADGSPKKLHVDHNHLTGAVRGLLCGKCNKGIGLFNDSLQLLASAHEYLKSNLMEVVDV